MVRPYEGFNQNGSVPATLLEAGASTRGRFASDVPMDNCDDAIALGSGGWKLYVLGWITFKDDNGVLRRATLCRGFDGNRGNAHPRFRAVDDPDYESNA